jgi:acyl-CoA hydrolase/GNAT superfamily N-acetyltransferase
MSTKPNTRVDADWQKKYANMIMTAEEAVANVRSGQKIFVSTAATQPLKLIKALVARRDELADVQITHSITLGEAPYAAQELSDHFSVNSFFVGANVRQTIQAGYGDYTPVSLSDIPHLFETGQMPIDVALIQVTPPDAQGRCSLGVSIDIVKSAAANAGLVIAQVNPQMPWTMGDSYISVNDLDILVPVDEPLEEASQTSDIVTGETVCGEDITKKIGEHVASLIEDGSTLGVGIGHIPHAVIEFLKDKKDLGIHTELVTDTIIDLMESGAITGNQKFLDRGKVVTSFAMGSKRLYDYVDGNPAFSFNPTEYVNDPSIIAQQNKMVAINTALEVDLTGQVCSDSMGTAFCAGIGGQADFGHGAARSTGGKTIIAIPSTAENGTVSRISGVLKPGAGVVASRAMVQYVVTEYGIAYLHGKSIQDRAMALISIAHPDFREKLLAQAIEYKYVRPEMEDVEGRVFVGPDETRTTMLLDDGTVINFRPISPTDEDATRDLFYSLSQETVYYRYASHLKSIPRKQLQNFVYIDHRNEVALVGTIPAATGEEIISIGRYYLDTKTNRAEVAFVVRDDWQGRGIGSFVLKHLGTIARRNGVAGFTAAVTRDNKAMQAVVDKSGLKVSSKLDDGVHHYEMDF